MEAKDLTVIPQDLSVNFSDRAVASMKEQRQALQKFINSQLRNGVDYGIIPGTPKPSLWKPGAEKIANLFQLGSRIVSKEKELDRRENFAMYAVTVEIFHLPSGMQVSQCEGVCNSHEKKYRYRKNKQGEAEETPIGDILNTLNKMAQKRAYVGAVIIATGASDFFTQDIEDDGNRLAVPPKPVTPRKVGDPNAYVVGFGTKYKGKTFNEMGKSDVLSFRSYLIDGAEADKKPLAGQAKEFVDAATAWLTQVPSGEASTFSNFSGGIKSG